MSQHPDEAVYETTPMASAIHLSLHPELSSSSISPSVSTRSTDSSLPHQHTPGLTTSPPCLTLVLVCRNKTKGQLAKRQLVQEHEELLLDRVRKGRKVRENWRDSLRVELEICDLSSPGGDNGLLALSRRLRET